MCLVAAEAARGVSDLFQTNKDTTMSAVGDSTVRENTRFVDLDNNDDDF